MASWIAVFIIEKVGRRKVSILNLSFGGSPLTSAIAHVVRCSRYVRLDGHTGSLDIRRWFWARYRRRYLPLRLQYLLRYWMVGHDLAISRRNCSSSYPWSVKRSINLSQLDLELYGGHDNSCQLHIYRIQDIHHLRCHQCLHLPSRLFLLP